jgi:quercetin dioxygenase-like cupin family protein
MNVTAISSRKSAAVALCAAGVFLLPAAAQATPPSGVTGEVLATGTVTHRLEVETHGRAEFVVQHVSIAPGGSTGWHYHPGTVLVVVQRGTVTRIDAHCRAVSYSAGGALVEPGGAHHVHIGRNLGTEPVELYLTYVHPVGSALSVAAPDPGCGD